MVLDGILDGLRYVAWAIWLASLPLALLFMFPFLMSTNSALGGGPKGWLLVFIDAAWIVGIPILLVLWGRS
jgi:hypothetical protein